SQAFQRTRTRERPGVECPSGRETTRELEPESLRVGVVATDQRVLVARMVGSEARCGERMESGGDGPVELGLDSLRERQCMRRRKDAVLRDPKLRRDREQG